MIRVHGQLQGLAIASLLHGAPFWAAPKAAPKALPCQSIMHVGVPGVCSAMCVPTVLQVRFVVLDEADQMLDMGFQEDMEVILQQVRKEQR